MAARGQQRKGRGAGRERAQQRKRDPRHEQHAEAAHHRHGREQQHQHRGGARRGGGRDRRAAGGRRALDRRTTLRTRRRAGGGRGVQFLQRLSDPRLELDRVVDGEPDEHRQHGDRGHGQGGPRRRERAEGERRGEQRESERQQPRSACEHEPERAGHHHDHRDQQKRDRARDRLGEIGDDHGLAGDRVARAGGRQLPLRHPHGGADRRDRRVALGLREPRPQPRRDQRAVTAREEVGEALLRDPGPLRGVEDDVGDEFLVLQARCGGESVGERQRDELRAVARGGHLCCFLAELAHFRFAQPARASGAFDRLFSLLAGAGRRLVEAGQLLLDLFGGLVEEGAGAEHDLDRAEFRQPPARSVHAALVRERRARHAPGEASLEAEQPLEVRTEHQLLQVAVDEHRDGLFAELAVEGLCAPVGGARSRDEAAGRSARLQPQREHGADDPQHRGEGQHEWRPPRGATGERGEQPRASHPTSAVGATPCRAARPRRRPGTAARTGFRTRTAPRPVPIRRSGPSRARRCAPPRAARS